MQMETIKKVLVWSLLLLVLPAVALAQNHIQLQSVAEVEKTVFNEEGQKEIKRLPAEKVLPGSEVIFTTYYENISKENVERAVITNPVPDHMVYSSGTASGFGRPNHLFGEQWPKLRHPRQSLCLRRHGPQISSPRQRLHPHPLDV
jgi:uncharacterized repeat protein (TIGR01451 family)